MSQPERRAASRAALLESAARGLSRHGYANLVLEDVAREAGYTRGALYHQFRGKEDLALEVIRWVDATWWREVGGTMDREDEPLRALLTMARLHAVFCRRDVARVVMALRLEFSDRDHPVGGEIQRVSRKLVARCARLVEAGRGDGSIPAGPAADAVAVGLLGALEGTVIALGGRAPADEALAVRAVAGVLGVRDPDALVVAEPSQAKEVVERFLERQRGMYAGGDVGAVEEMLAEDVVWHVPGASPIAGEHRGREAVVDYFRRRRDLAGGPIEIFRSGEAHHDEAMVQLADGRAVIGGREVGWRTAGVYRVADGKIAEAWLVPLDAEHFDRVWSGAVRGDDGAGGGVSS